MLTLKSASVQVPMIGPTQTNFGFLDKGKEIVGAIECITSLSRWSPVVCSSEDSGFGSWSLSSEGWLSPFAKTERSLLKRIWIFCCVRCRVCGRI
jgi:hypothetical protein